MLKLRRLSLGRALGTDVNTSQCANSGDSQEQFPPRHHVKEKRMLKTMRISLGRAFGTAVIFNQCGNIGVSQDQFSLRYHEKEETNCSTAKVCLFLVLCNRRPREVSEWWGFKENAEEHKRVWSGVVTSVFTSFKYRFYV